MRGTSSQHTPQRSNAQHANQHTHTHTHEKKRFVLVDTTLKKLFLGKNTLSGLRCHILRPVTSMGLSSRSSPWHQSINRQVRQLMWNKNTLREGRATCNRTCTLMLRVCQAVAML